MALFGAPRAFLGLDIGLEGGALVEVVDRGRRVELATYAVFPRPAENSVAAVAAAVSAAMNRAQVSADVAAFSLPSRSIFSAAMTLPAMPAEQRARVIKFKAQHIIPATPAHVKLSTVQHPRSDGMLNVYVTATPKPLIAWYWQLAKKLHLEIVKLEPEIFSLIRTHTFAPNSTILFCSVGRDITFHLVADAVPLASRTLDIVAATVGKKTVADELARNLRHLVGDRQLTKIIVTGPGANTPAVIDTVAAVLGRRPEITNPWHGLAYPAELESVVAELGPRLAVAIGLARSSLAPKL